MLSSQIEANRGESKAIPVPAASPPPPATPPASRAAPPASTPAPTASLPPMSPSAPKPALPASAAARSPPSMPSTAPAPTALVLGTGWRGKEVPTDLRRLARTVQRHRRVGRPEPKILERKPQSLVARTPKPRTTTATTPVAGGSHKSLAEGRKSVAFWMFIAGLVIGLAGLFFLEAPIVAIALIILGTVTALVSWIAGDLADRL